MSNNKRNGRLDLGRLELGSLQKYARKYRLPVSTNSRHDLETQVSKHFNSQQFMLDDEEVLIAFIKALKNNAARPKPPPQGYPPRQPQLPHHQLPPTRR